MVLSVHISTETEQRLAAKAKLAGVDVATYAARHLDMISQHPRSLEEISGDIARHVSQTGMTEDELSDFLEEEKHAMRAEEAMAKKAR